MNNYQNQWPGFEQQQNQTNSIGFDRAVGKVMRNVYMRMFLALLVTSATAFFCASSEAILQLVFSGRFPFFVLLLVEVGLVIYLTSRINKMSITTANVIFYLYSIINGVVFSCILLAYTMSSIVSTFVITAGVFGAMSLYGYFTGNDLSKLGSFLFMALIGLILCSIVNIFMQSSQFEWIISFAGVAIFIGLTAWDTQKIKRMVETSYAYGSSVEVSKIATMGALSLYLDFVNLFLYLLRFFGNSRN